MLQIEDLEVKYQEQWALRGVSLRLDPGDLVGLIGSNGSGKTTLLNSVSGLVRPSSGKIIFEGQEMGGISPDQICRLGLVQVPEGRKLFARMTIQENLELGAYLPGAKRKYKESLERVFTLFPRLLERRRQYAGSLSGGEQQMLALGRGLMACPRLLMMDEPSLGLAPIAAKEIFRTIGQLNRDGLTILLVSQEVLQAFELAGKIYLLENGKIALYGPASELASDPRIKESYLGL